MLGRCIYLFIYGLCLKDGLLERQMGCKRQIGYKRRIDHMWHALITGNRLRDWLQKTDRLRSDQCCGSGSGFTRVPGSGSGRACSLLRAEGFSCNLDVLYRGLGLSIVNRNFWSNKYKFFSALFFQYLVIKTLDPYPDPDSLELLNPDPQNWLKQMDSGVPAILC